MRILSNLSDHVRHWLFSFGLIGAGMLNTLAFAPYEQSYMPILTLLLLGVALLLATSKRQAWWYGWCYGVGWFGLGISWVHVSIATFGGMPLLASLGLMALLVAYLALFPALALWLSFCFAPAKPHWRLALLPIFWVLAENLRSWVLTGFPWLSLGYSQTEGWFGSLAPLIGETGITFVMVVLSMSLVFTGWQIQLPTHAAIKATSKAHTKPVWQFSMALSVVLLALPLFSHKYQAYQPTGQQQAVTLVQGNIEQSLRWDAAEELNIMKKYMTLTRPQLKERLIIWPEAAIPQLEIRAQAYLINLDMQLAEQNSSLVTGILDIRRDGTAYNGMVVLGQFSDQASKGDYRYEGKNRYRKHHLLPIGEFVPFEDWLRDVAPFFDLPNSSFNRGDYIQTNLLASNQQLLAALCFEIAFPRQIQANFAADTDLLLTVSNDAWFGDSIGPHQHLQIAQMRAREFARPLLRATNNGITAIATPDGKISHRLPQFEDGVLNADITLVQGRSLYAITGDWPLYALNFMLLVFVLWRYTPWQKTVDGQT